jgi:hypothetical protein
MEERVEYLRPNVQEAEERMTTNNGPAIEEMLRDAEVATEPGDMVSGQVISQNAEMTMTTSQLQSAGWVYVYDTVTADRSVVNRNMLPQQLQKQRLDGSYFFSTRKPEGGEPVIGDINCLLHVDGPDREKYDRMGLVTCTKIGFRNELNRDQHLRSRHPRAYATLENERVREDREAERLERMALTESIKAMAESNRGMRDA